MRAEKAEKDLWKAIDQELALYASRPPVQDVRKSASTATLERAFSAAGRKANAVLFGISMPLEALSKTGACRDRLRRSHRLMYVTFANHTPENPKVRLLPLAGHRFLFEILLYSTHNTLEKG